MKNVSLKQIILIGLIVIGLFTMLNTCNSCNAKKQAVNTQHELDSVQIEFKEYRENSLSFERAKLLFQKENLKTEMRMLINTNQIFLTKTRPDGRVLEIQKEIKEIEELEKTVK